MKLVKNLETLDRLPVNHTIYTKLLNEMNEKNKLNGDEKIDPKVKIIFTHILGANF